MTARIPQVADIVKVKGSGEITIKKDLRKLFDTDKKSLYITVGEEVLLSTRKSKGSQEVALTNNRISVEGRVAELLQLEKGSHVAMIQRDGGLALKHLVIEDWRDGVKPQILDRETPYAVSRSAARIFWPEEALPRLRDECKGLRLEHDVRKYLCGRESLWAWRARKLLGMREKGDAELRQRLVKQRVDGQQENGSWGDSLMRTARNLRELVELGTRGSAAPVRKAATWLLSRPESPHKPGAFLLTDELIDELDFCVQKGKTKPGKHFRERTKVEEKVAAAEGDDMFRRGCGPRFLWPNAVTIEALTLAGYGEHPRVKAAVAAAVGSDWCECHISYRGKPKTPTDARLTQRVEDVKHKFRYGGLNTLQELGILALSRKCDFQTRRVSHRREGNVDVYEVAPKKGHSGPCGLVLARCLSCVKDTIAQRWLEPRLWVHGTGPVLQYAPDGNLCCPAAMDLDTAARYDYPVTKMRIMIVVPDIVRTQNDDGSWGHAPHVDMTTFAVVRALLKVRGLLPKSALP
jgi:hypothetical protein